VPLAGGCAGRRTPVEVVADGPRRIVRVVFSVDGRPAASDSTGSQSVFAATVPLKRGRHTLVATAVDAQGRFARAQRRVHTCGA
jgi:hypothetical protein